MLNRNEDISMGIIVVFYRVNLSKTKSFIYRLPLPVVSAPKDTTVREHADKVMRTMFGEHCDLELVGCEIALEGVLLQCNQRP